MKKFQIQEGDVTFATIEANTGAAALRKARKQFPRRAADYNGYRGPIEWRAFLPGMNAISASLIVHVR